MSWPYDSAAYAAPDEYRAFSAKNKTGRLRIRSLNAPFNAPGYNILLNVVSDEQGTHFLLVYTILTVMVRGRNLRRVIFAVENEMADFIQEFDATRWPQPEADAPLISSIEIRVIENNGKAHDAEY